MYLFWMEGMIVDPEENHFGFVVSHELLITKSSQY